MSQRDASLPTGCANDLELIAVVHEWVAALADWVLGLVGTPWVFGGLFAFATIDGFFPPIPSESVVIALAALAWSTGEPNFWLLGAVAAAGAFTGDQIAYSIGKRIPVRSMRFMQGPRAQRTVDWAEKALMERGAAFIIAARYIPVGRVAVNMTAGAVRFPRIRFTFLAAIAAVTWSIYSVLLGIGAGVLLGDRPWLAVAVGVVGGVLIGLVIDNVIKRVMRSRRGRSPVRSAEGAGAGADTGSGDVSALTTAASSPSSATAPPEG